MNILGINAYHGDSATCLVQDGKLVAAAAEERFNRKRHWSGFPGQSIRFCLEAAGIGPQDLDHVAVSRDPNAHIQDRVLTEAFHAFPRMMTLKQRLDRVGEVPNLRAAFCRALEVEPDAVRAEFHNVEHHHAHLASAFFVSPFNDAAVLSVDGFGDFVSTMMARGTGNHLEVLDWIEYPHSLGLLYTAVTQYLGFPEYGDEGKVMGLAPYGQPRYQKAFEEIVRTLPEGRFELNLDYFTHHTHGVEMTWDGEAPRVVPVWSSKMVDLLGPARRGGGPLEDRHRDIAASLQGRLEEVLLHVCRELYRKTGLDRICLAGGVALNCTFNGLIRAETPFREVYVQAAAGDDGTAIGAAFHVYHEQLWRPRSFVMEHAFTGPTAAEEEIAAALERHGLGSTQLASTEQAAKEAAHLIAAGKVVGWFQGAMEFGPRALGNRSILADPRRVETRAILNRRIKQRELFRPFAPSVLLERTGDYFEQEYPSPFMLMAYPAREQKRGEIPAVLHVDGTGRLQTVDRRTNPAFWTLIRSFEEETGVPVVLNTSFNENEPIVCSPEDAIRCFLRTAMDALVIGRRLVLREGQESAGQATARNDGRGDPQTGDAAPGGCS